MHKFIALYCMPMNDLAEWGKKPKEEREAEEKRLQGEWHEWTQKHHDAIVETSGAGKTKRVTGAGMSDTKNDIMMYSIVNAESPEAAAAMFVGHPHLQIPSAWIDVMPANQLPGMG